MVSGKVERGRRLMLQQEQNKKCKLEMKGQSELSPHAPSHRRRLDRLNSKCIIARSHWGEERKLVD